MACGAELEGAAGPGGSALTSDVLCVWAAPGSPPHHRHLLLGRLGDPHAPRWSRPHLTPLPGLLSLRSLQGDHVHHPEGSWRTPRRHGRECVLVTFVREHFRQDLPLEGSAGKQERQG